MESIVSRLFEQRIEKLLEEEPISESVKNRVLVASLGHMKYYAEPKFGGKLRIIAASDTYKEKWVCGVVNFPLTVDSLKDVLRRNDIKRDPHSTMNFDNIEYHEEEIEALNKKFYR